MIKGFNTITKKLIINMGKVIKPETAGSWNNIRTLTMKLRKHYQPNAHTTLSRPPQMA